MCAPIASHRSICPSIVASGVCDNTALQTIRIRKAGIRHRGFVVPSGIVRRDGCEETKKIQKTNRVKIVTSALVISTLA